MAVWRSFFLNCYCHHSSTFLLNGDEAANIFHCMEDVIQGGSLSMVSYGIGVLPLIKNLKSVYTEITQPRYCDDASALGKFYNLELYFNQLKYNILVQDYYPNTTKRIMIVHPDNLRAGKMFGVHHGLRVCTNASYLGSYTGGDESKRKWLKDQTGKWEIKIHTVTKTAGKYPQESYAGVVCSIQS